MKNIYKLSFFCIALSSLFPLCACSDNSKENSESSDITMKNTMQISELHEESNNLKSSSMLNFDDAIIDIPIADTAYEMKLTVKKKDNEEYINNFKETYDKFTGSTLNKDDIMLGFDNGDGTFRNVKYGESKELTDEFFQASYQSDDGIYDSLAMIHFTSFLITDYKKLSETSISLGNVRKAIYFGSPEDDDENTHNLAENAYNFVNENYPYFFGFDSISFKPFSYQKSDNVYYFVYQPVYENIPFNTDYFSAIGDEDENIQINDTGAFMETVVDTDDNFYRICNFPDFNIEKTKTYSELISPQYACSLVEKEISDDVKFIVSRFDLVYNYSQFNDDNGNPIYWESRPYWKISIDKSGIPNYPLLAFMVDAVTGEVKSYQKG